MKTIVVYELLVGWFGFVGTTIVLSCSITSFIDTLESKRNDATIT